MIISSTAGETAKLNLRQLAYDYFDARAKELGLPKTERIIIIDGPTDYDEDYDSFMFRKSFIDFLDENGNMYILPRQLDTYYDVEQYRDVLVPECADFIIKWFKAQKRLNENFTFYVESIGALIESVEYQDNPLTEEYKDYGRFRVVAIQIE